MPVESDEPREQVTQLTVTREGTLNSMKVILKRDVKGLGRAGDVKEVKNGYARNFLFPNGAAVVADAGALKNWERHRGRARGARSRGDRPMPRRWPSACAS